LENPEVSKLTEIIRQLESFLSKSQILSGQDTLKPHSSDFSSFDSPKIPSLLLKPKNVSEIQKIVNFANKNMISITPCSSKIHFYGSSIPAEGGFIIDLSEMNRIIKIDARNKSTTIETGVTFSQLEIIKDRGLMPLFPLCPPAQKSVITSYLEREPLLVPKLEYYEPLLTMEVVLPTGEILRTGSAAVKPSKFAEYLVPFGPGLNWNQIFQGAQGTLGIITSATIKIEHIPKLTKMCFISSNDITELIDPLYEIQRNLLGYECLILNNRDLSLILANKSSDILSLKDKLPQWFLIICLSSGVYLPEEKIKQEENDLLYSLKEFNIKPSTTVSGLEKQILPIIRQSYKAKYWKLKVNTNFQDIIFITTLDMVSSFIHELDKILSELDYPFEDVGCYIQPLVRGGACQLEFSFFYDSLIESQRQKAKNLYETLILKFFKMGAFFSRPYGTFLSDIVYKNNLAYTHVLNEIKQIFDPNNIMNPEKLCFNGGVKP
jgi:hypothetical protein